MSDLADRWLRAVPTLVSPELRMGYMRAELDGQPAVDAAIALDFVCGEAEQADQRAFEVIAAVVPLLAEPALEHRVEMLRELAILRALLPLGRFLRRRMFDAFGEAVVPAPERPASGRGLTLGERKSLARTPKRTQIDKLLKDPHPAVIHNLLGNPKITEVDVVRIAARRPANRDVISEIARHPKWSQRAAIRLAIIQNPGAPPEIAIPMVSLLTGPELLAITRAADVPAVVRAAAGDLLARRPPGSLAGSGGRLDS